MKWTFLFLLYCPLLLGQNTILFDKNNSLLPDNDLTSIAVDQNGIKWIGSSKFGLIRFNDTSWTVFNKDNSSIKGNYINSIVVDRKNKIWFSFSQPLGGLACYDGKKFTIFTTKNSKLPDNSVITIIVDSNDNKWIGTSKGIVKYDNENWITYEKFNSSLNDPIVRAIDIDKNGKIWVAANNGIISLEKDKTETFTVTNSELQLGTVRAIKIDKNDKINIGYGGGFGAGGFSILENNQWIHFNKANSKLPDQMIRDIEINNKNQKWYATNDGVLEIKDNRWKVIKFKDEKYHNVIMDISIEKDSILWIATTLGLNCYGAVSKDFFKNINSTIFNNNDTSQTNTNSNLETRDTNKVYLIVQKRPQFPGGEKALKSYIKENLNYPISAKEKKIEGDVYIEFIVEKDGSLSSVHLMQLPTEFDNEAIRLINSMPKWIPAEQDKKIVRVQYSLSIKFAL